MYTVSGRRQPTIKLAISGTYSTGKSTTTEAVSIAAAIPRTHAMTSREILIELAPGKTVMELNSQELLQLGLRRFEERVRNEAALPSFVSDGSVVHEWVYSEARRRVGINPGATWLIRTVKAAAGIGRTRAFQEYNDIYGAVTKERAIELYDAYVHLPVEFTMNADGHRPVSEPFRRLSDDLLLESLEEMGIEYHVIGGSVEERVDAIMRRFDMPVVVPLADAIAEARERVTAATAILEADERFKAAQRKKSLARRLAYAMRY